MKLISKKACALVTLLLITNILLCQKKFTKYDELPGLVKSYKPAYDNKFPAWSKMLYADSINFKTIDSLFRIEEGEGLKEEEGKETAIKRYYTLWRKAVLPYVRKNGKILLPGEIDLKQRNERLRKRNVTQKPLGSLGNWSFEGPVETWWENNGSVRDHNEAPYQLNIYSFDIAPSDTNILYAGSETGYVNKTSDKGLSWTGVGMNYYFGGSITAIAIHPTNPNIVYVAAGNQMHKSTDGGITWQPMLNDTMLFYAQRIKIDKNSPDKIYAAADVGFFVSTDAGLTWTRKWVEASWDVEIKPDNSNIIYAITSRNVSGKEVYKVFISKDGGSNFTQDDNFNFNDEITSGALLAVTPANPNYIYAAELAANDTPKIYKGVYNSSIGGIDWRFLVQGKTDSLIENNWQGYFDFVFEISPTDVNTIYFGTSGLYKSINGGRSFTPLWDYGQPAVIELHPDQQDMKIVNENEAWISSDGGLVYTKDAFASNTNAFTRNNGLVGSDFWGFDQGWNEDLVVGGRYHNGNTAIGEYYEGKALLLGGSESPTGLIMPGRTRHAAFEDIGGHILPSSLTSPEEGSFAFSKYPNDYYYGSKKGSFIVHPNYYNTCFLGRDNAIWKSSDGGSSFSVLHDFGNAVWQIEISRANPNVIYADIENVGLSRSNDGGNTWVAKPALTADPYGYDWWRGNLTFVISPFDENVLYACPQDNWLDNKRKIFRSIDGGNTWTDWTTPTIADYGTKRLCIQPLQGNKDGIYLFTSYSWYGSLGGKVFFRSTDMDDWIDYSNNFPAGTSLTGNGALPFFRDAKLRACGNMGVWETPLYDTSFPVTAINPMVDKNKGYACARDTLYFDDYSIVKHEGAAFTWSFTPAPVYVSDVHARNPKVVFGDKGKYTVKESITVNGTTYSKAIADMVEISNNVCGTIDTVPGSGVTFSGTEKAVISPLNITTNHFSISFWIKPDSVQNFGAGLVLTNGAPKIGLDITDGLELFYHWNDLYWWYSSGLFLTPNKWNQVAMVIEPNSCTIYLNGIGKVIDNEVHDPLIFASPFQLGLDGDDFSDRHLKGQIDEVCFWNNALTQNEVREQMHLIKNPATNHKLIHYYQFNETSGSIAYDKVGLNHAQIGNTTYTTSSAPVGAGFSKRLNVNAAGKYDFDSTGLVIDFSPGTLPDGELCVSRINQNSQNSSSTDSALLFGRYWIVNNFGLNQTFTNIKSMQLNDCGPVSDDEVNNPSKISLFKRGSFDDASSDWVQIGNTSTVQSLNSSSLLNFALPNVTSFSQFELQRTDRPLSLQQITLRAELSGSKNILVLWQTLGEDAVEYYVVERSIDGINFQLLNQTTVRNTSGKNNYAYTDMNPPVGGVIFYRIKVAHLNSPVTYSAVAKIQFRQQHSVFELFPSILPKGQMINTNVTFSDVYTLSVFDAEGHTVFKEKYAGNAKIKLGNLPAGTYIFNVIWKNGIKNGKIVIY